jgi:hypothetical protein
MEFHHGLSQKRKDFKMETFGQEIDALNLRFNTLNIELFTFYFLSPLNLSPKTFSNLSSFGPITKVQ